jgi:predicted O-methyltransferase YrrM
MIKPEVSLPSPECPNPKLWHCYDGMATEVEVLEFLESLVRMLKPRVIVETGTYLGHGTLHLARAAAHNTVDGLVGSEVHTAEVDDECRLKAEGYLVSLNLASFVTFHPTTGVEMIEAVSSPIDFAFLDSDLETRIGEMRELFPKMSKSCVVAVHDTSTFHAKHGGPRDPFLAFAKDHGMQIINLDTPRGLCLLRR